MTMPTIQRAPGAVFRKECGLRIIATLIRPKSNYDLSEECAQGRCHQPRAGTYHSPWLPDEPLDVPEPLIWRRFNGSLAVSRAHRTGILRGKAVAGTGCRPLLRWAGRCC